MESKSFKCEGNRNDHLMHYEQDFDNACERRESECWGVLIKYLCKVEDEQVINLQMTQQLKTKTINVIPWQPLFHQCKAKFLLEAELYS